MLFIYLFLILYSLIYFLANKDKLIIWLCLTRTGNYQIHKSDWLKLILKADKIFPSRPVMLCSEKVVN